MPSINDKMLDDIFGIPKDGSNIKEEEDESQETSYAEVIKADTGEGFEEKAKKLNSDLAKDAPPVSVSYVSKEEENGSKQQPELTVKSAVQEPGNSFEKILKKSVLPDSSSSKEIEPVVKEQAINNENTTFREDDEETEETVTSNSSISYNPSKANESGWILNSPSPMFNNFYSEKRLFIQNLTRNGNPLPINNLMDELRSCHISVNTELMDLEGMANKFNKIQSLLDRVVQIKIQATGQCSACKRGVELLRGVLARVTYEKPAARQDGVIYDHMKDVEMYACGVEGLEQAAKDVYHNLLESKEILSRKISITLELVKQQSISDSHEKNYSSLSENAKVIVEKVAAKPSLSPEIAAEGYDRLDVQEAVKSQSSASKSTINKTGKTGTISWLD